MAPTGHGPPARPARRAGLALLVLALGVGPGCAAPEAAAPPAVVPDPPRPERAAMAALVVREARDLGVDPALALAVAHAESAFDPRARSPVGARGLMQVMPATVEGEYALHPDALWDPRLNVRVGLHFLKRLLDRYDDERHALSWYNGGSAVGPPGRARVLPATRAYVARVQRLKRLYAAELRAGAPVRLAGRE